MKNRWNPETIRELRKRLNLTQRDLAAKLGYSSYWAVYEWEAGRRRPNRRAQMLLTLLEKSHEN